MHPNERALRSFYAAFENENYSSVLRALLREDVCWHVSGSSPLAGDFVGVDAVLSAMRRYEEHSRGTLKLDTRSIFADDKHGVAIHVATAELPGFEYRAHEVDVFHIQDGRITEFWSFSEGQDATDKLWSSDVPGSDREPNPSR